MIDLLCTAVVVLSNLSSLLLMSCFSLCRTSGAAAWYATQEAAKHCTGVRMRTHLGNPSQSFAALERMLQDMLSKLTSAASEPPSVVTDAVASAPQLYSVPAARSINEVPLLEPAWMLLEMMQALEKNMYSAYAGCCLRSAGYANAAISFYRSNRKVSMTCSSFAVLGRFLCVKQQYSMYGTHIECFDTVL